MNKIFINKEGEEFEFICATGLYVFLANFKGDIIAVGDLAFSRQYKLKNGKAK